MSDRNVGERKGAKISSKSGCDDAKISNGSGCGAAVGTCDDANWNKIVEAFPEANFLQSPMYGEMNEILGEKVITIEDYDGNTPKSYALTIVRNAKRGRYLEIPCGPLLNWDNRKLVKDTFEKIAEVARAEKCVFVRVRPQMICNEKNLKILRDLGLKKSPMHLAAEHTVIVDLRKTTDEILAGMRRQTRYEVRRAMKLGIKVKKGNSEELFREFRKVQADTAKRQGFVPPSLKVLLAEREAFGEQIEIYVAKTASGGDAKMKAADNSDAGVKEAPNDFPQNAAIAYGLIIKDGKEADYYEAASTQLNRKLPGAYALLWQAMQDLKEEGYARFNLWGIAPAGQPNHRYAGVTTFKTGFGGDVVEFVPAHDLVINPIGYLRNLAVETVRRKRRHL